MEDLLTQILEELKEVNYLLNGIGQSLFYLFERPEEVKPEELKYQYMDMPMDETQKKEECENE